VGPPEIRLRSSDVAIGKTIESISGLKCWLETAEQEPDQPTTIATFVIDNDGQLRLANRRTEHVACAGGNPVLAAGEMTFRVGGSVEVVEITNQSTGYCPEPNSWTAVEIALQRLGVNFPEGFTTEFLFRRCESCGQINIVKEDWFVCSVCDAELPRLWNFDTLESK
jgi:hypothetical protein